MRVAASILPKGEVMLSESVGPQRIGSQEREWHPMWYIEQRGTERTLFSSAPFLLSVPPLPSGMEQWLEAFRERMR